MGPILLLAHIFMKDLAGVFLKFCLASSSKSNKHGEVRTLTSCREAVNYFLEIYATGDALPGREA